MFEGSTSEPLSDVRVIGDALPYGFRKLYVNTAFKGCHVRHAERDTCCIGECGTYEHMNVGARKL